EKLNDRNEALEQLDTMINDAKAYKAAVSSGTQEGVDMRWEAFIPVLNNDIPVFIHAQRSLQIKAAVEWCSKNDLKMILMGGADSWKEWEILKENDIPVIYENPLSLPMRRDERTDTKYTVPRKLWEKGVKFCTIGSTSNFQTPHQRGLPYHAAMTAAFGLPKDEALKSITLYAAEILGISEYVGSLEIGKDATLIVTTGDPLEITSNVEIAFINGAQTDLSDRHKSLDNKYREKYRQIKENSQE
ncbi:MAG: amidohydrolase family protein, partial [Candidatus Marinimicrobia bacterium]|nr:amidohydrolase family protein [Candidatus Neomarinimicrobiota bacterium]MBT4853004.1 amidohydrolase family protein [Candidatus Neomarinimicrobiota bacterium]MBT5212758.1 amidohydrolase family protein [Candidatus Neomarinimicrobiota bacterium]